MLVERELRKYRVEISKEIGKVPPTIARSKLGNAPYNSFMIVAGDRGREIHLPGYEPTPLASRSHFGSGDDASNAGNNYTGWTGLPWVMQLPRSFDYPRENAPITKAH